MFGEAGVQRVPKGQKEVWKGNRMRAEERIDGKRRVYWHEGQLLPQALPV
jgi:hypothetical protein